LPIEHNKLSEEVGGFHPPVSSIVALFKLMLGTQKRLERFWTAAWRVPQGFFAGCKKQKNLHLAGLIMVDAGGFEPPTARFVAEYSIQLSYASIWYFKSKTLL
jgi:hypothetical protein